MSNYQPFKKLNTRNPSEIREIKVAYNRSSDLSDVSFKTGLPLESNQNHHLAPTEDSEFTFKTETSLQGPKTRAAMVPTTMSMKSLNSRFKTESQVFSLSGETTTSSNKGTPHHAKCKSGVNFHVRQLDLSDSESCCDEDFLSDDDEMPDKPHSEEVVQSTLQLQNQYYQHINEALEVRDSFMNRKQVRYLGIVIEKDDEDFQKKNDTKRVYLPTKEKYMEIVKGARVLHLDEMERNKNLCEVPKTMKRLKRKVKDLVKQKQN